MRVKALETETSHWSDNNPLLPHLYVGEAQVFTGILDILGEPIMRKKNPIGFGRDKEWK